MADGLEPDGKLWDQDINRFTPIICFCKVSHAVSHNNSADLIYKIFTSSSHVTQPVHRVSPTCKNNARGCSFVRSRSQGIQKS
jgi:hypothetical protein